MADILQTASECLFFTDLLPHVPAETRTAVAMQLARSLNTHGMAADEWRTDPGVFPLLTELSRHIGAAWLPSAIMPSSRESPFPELKAALSRREKIAGRTAPDLLGDAQGSSGDRRIELLTTVEDAIHAAQIAGAFSEDDARISRAGVRLLNGSSMPWAAARPEVEAVEAECRGVRERNAGHAEARIMLGRALLQRSRTTNDRDAVPLLQEAVELLVAADNDPARAAWPGAIACGRMGARSPKSEALRLIELAGSVLERPGGPAPLQLAPARIELLLARANFENDADAAQRCAAALQVWEIAYTQQRDDSQALVLRARILRLCADRAPRLEAEKSFDEARQSLQEALSLDPGHYGARILLGDVLRALAELQPPAQSLQLWAEAEELYQKAAGIDRDRPDAFAGLMAVAVGRAEQDSGALRAQILEEAWTAAKSEITRFQGFAGFHRRLALLRMAQSNLPGASQTALGLDASQHLEAAGELLPSDAVTVQNWGNLLLQQARQAESEPLLAAAMAKFQAAIELRPGYKWALNGWARALALQGNHGSFDAEIGACETALTKYAEALQTDPTFRAALLGRAAMRVRLSRLKTRAEALPLLDQAVSEAEACVQSNAEDWQAYRALGQAQYTQGERRHGEEALEWLDRALASFRRARGLRTDDPDLTNNEGDALRAQARQSGEADLFDQALAVYRAVPKDSGQASVAALIGAGYTQVQRTFSSPRQTPEQAAAVNAWLEEARGSFADAISLAPKNHLALRGMAATLRRLAELDPKESAALLDEAERHARAALEARPGYPASLTLMGDVYYAQATIPKIDIGTKWSRLGKASGQYSAALAVLADQFTALSGSGRTAVALSEIAASSELLPKAEEQFERALEVRPGDRDVQKRLEEVRKRMADRGEAQPSA
jgi:tetratricopeptide (TPR) repeat protein